jgi:hypothetical protein
MVGVAIFVLMSLFLSEFEAYIFVLAFGLGKEIWDHNYVDHVSDLLDFLATISIPSIYMLFLLGK